MNSRISVEDNSSECSIEELVFTATNLSENSSNSIEKESDKLKSVTDDILFFLDESDPEVKLETESGDSVRLESFSIEIAGVSLGGSANKLEEGSTRNISFTMDLFDSSSEISEFDFEGFSDIEENNFEGFTPIFHESSVSRLKFNRKCKTIFPEGNVDVESLISVADPCVQNNSNIKMSKKRKFEKSFSPSTESNKKFKIDLFNSDSENTVTEFEGFTKNISTRQKSKSKNSAVVNNLDDNFKMKPKITKSVTTVNIQQNINDVNKWECTEEKMKSEDSIGIYCDKIGCSISWLESGEALKKPVKITNGIVYELNEFAKKIAWESKYVAKWILRLSGYKKAMPDDEDLKKIFLLMKRRKALTFTLAGKNLLKKKLQSFDSGSFSLPTYEKLKNKKQIAKSPTFHSSSDEIRLDIFDEIPSDRDKKFNSTICRENVKNKEFNEIAVCNKLIVNKDCSPNLVPSKLISNIITKKLDPAKLTSNDISKNFDQHLIRTNDSSENIDKTKLVINIKQNLEASNLTINKPLVTNITKDFTQSLNELNSDPIKDKKCDTGLVQKNIFEVKDNFIGDHCHANKIDIKLLNSNETMTSPFITNGMVYELYYFFKERKATLTSLVNTLFRLKGEKATKPMLIAAMARLHKVVKVLWEQKYMNNLDMPFEEFSFDQSNSSSFCNQKLRPLIYNASFEIEEDSKLDDEDHKPIQSESLELELKVGDRDITTNIQPIDIEHNKKNITSNNDFISDKTITNCKLNVTSDIQENQLDKVNILQNQMKRNDVFFSKVNDKTENLISPEILPTTTNIHISENSYKRVPINNKNAKVSGNETNITVSDTKTVILKSIDYIGNFEKEMKPADSCLSNKCENDNLSSKTFHKTNIAVQNVKQNNDDSPIRISHKRQCIKKSELKNLISHKVEEPKQVNFESQQDQENSDGVFDLNSTKGDVGKITRGDIVYLYTRWLKKKMEGKESVFVTDLSKDVEILKNERKVFDIRIPVGTLMSSSVKLFEEFRSLAKSNMTEAKNYLLGNWLEDLDCLINCKTGVRNYTQKNHDSVITNHKNLKNNSSNHKNKVSTIVQNDIANESPSNQISGNKTLKIDDQVLKPINNVNARVPVVRKSTSPVVKMKNPNSHSLNDSVISKKVKKIIGYRIVKADDKSGTEYRVRYVSQPPSCDAWIKEDALGNDILLKSFWDALQKQREKNETSSDSSNVLNKNNLENFVKDSSVIPPKTIAEHFHINFINSLDTNLVNYHLEIEKDLSRRVKVSKEEVLKIYDNWRSQNKCNSSSMNVGTLIDSVKNLMGDKKVRNFNSDCILDACFRMSLMRSKLKDKQLVKDYLETDFTELMKASGKHQSWLREENIMETNIQADEDTSIKPDLIKCSEMENLDLALIIDRVNNEPELLKKVDDCLKSPNVNPFKKLKLMNNAYKELAELGVTRQCIDRLIKLQM